jgi:hypothetical protein
MARLLPRFCIVSLGALSLSAACHAGPGSGAAVYLKTNPWAYDDAFGDVVTLALVKSWTGDTYRQALGEKYWRGGRGAGFYKPCAAADLPDAFLKDPGHCRISSNSSDNVSCKNNRGCSSLRFSPDVLADKNIRKEIEGALSDPCKIISYNSIYQSNDYYRDVVTKKNHASNYRPLGLSFSENELKGIFKCSSRAGAIKYSVDLSREKSIYRISLR